MVECKSNHRCHHHHEEEEIWHAINVHWKEQIMQIVRDNIDEDDDDDGALL